MYTGITGKVKIGASEQVAYISNWSVEDSMTIVEVSSLGERYKGKVAGQGNWTASAEGTVVFDTDKSHRELFAAMHAGESVDCEFYLDDNTSKPIKFGGKGLIETLNVSLSAEDKGTISISISGVGELSFPDMY